MQGCVPISIHKPQTRFPLLTQTIENTLHFTFVASSKMLISSNQATVCCLLITSDCTAHYASEVNYEQNDGKIGPQSWSSSHQFSTSSVACWFWLPTYCPCVFILFLFCSPVFAVYQSHRLLMSQKDRYSLCMCSLTEKRTKEELCDLCLLKWPLV